MMSPPEIEQLMDALRHGRLTAPQQAQLEEYLATQPAQRTTAQEELALNQLLRQLADAPLSSNFTARVVQAARRMDGPGARPERPLWIQLLFTRWVPRAAVAAIALSAGVLTYQQHQLAERRELAQGLAKISQLATETPVEFLQNFEAIQRLNQAPHDRDRELIAALQ
jgi:anti-sigma factor RsiW